MELEEKKNMDVKTLVQFEVEKGILGWRFDEYCKLDALIKDLLVCSYRGKEMTTEALVEGISEALKGHVLNALNKLISRGEVVAVTTQTWKVPLEHRTEYAEQLLREVEESLE